MNARCSRCGKNTSHCVCALVSKYFPHPEKTRLKLLVLQHPAEKKKDEGTGTFLPLSLLNATVRVGLSWPNFRKALDLPPDRPLDPKRWAVLYLGTRKESRPRMARDSKRDAPNAAVIVSRQGAEIPLDASIQKSLEGLVILDGTWAQAKTLWWRNPWITRLHRLFLIPAQRSAYSQLRKEPRRECVSSLESATLAFEILGESPETVSKLKKMFSEFVHRSTPQQE